MKVYLCEIVRYETSAQDNRTVPFHETETPRPVQK